MDPRTREKIINLNQIIFLQMFQDPKSGFYLYRYQLIAKLAVYIFFESLQ